MSNAAKLKRLQRNCDETYPGIGRPWVVRVDGVNVTVAATTWSLAMVRGRLVKGGSRGSNLVARNREVRGLLAAPLLKGIRCDARKLIEFLREPRAEVDSGIQPVIINGAIVNRFFLLRALQAVGCGVSSGRIRVAAAERWIRYRNGAKTRQHLCVFGDGWQVLVMPMVRRPKSVEARFR